MKSKGADRLSRPGLGVGRRVRRGVQSSKRLVFFGGGDNLFCFLVPYQVLN